VLIQDATTELRTEPSRAQDGRVGARPGWTKRKDPWPDVPDQGSHRFLGDISEGEPMGTVGTRGRAATKHWPHLTAAIARSPARSPAGQGHTAPYQRGRQPPDGAQAAAALSALDDPALAPPVPKSENALRACVLPHSGHFS